MAVLVMCHVMLKSQQNSYLKPVIDGFKSDYPLTAADTSSCFDITGDTLYASRLAGRFNSPNLIYAIKESTGDTIASYERPQEVNLLNLHGLTLSPDKKSIWTGFNSSSGNDPIYAINTETGEWEKKAELEGVYFIEFVGENMFALARIWGKMGMEAAIYQLDLSGENKHRLLIDFGENDASWTFCVDDAGNLYSGFSDILFRSKLLRWNADDINDIVNGTRKDTLKAEDATELIDFKNMSEGLFACDMDNSGQLFLVFKTQTENYIGKWNAKYGEEGGFDTISTGKGISDLNFMRVNGNGTGKGVLDGIYATSSYGQIAKIWNDKLPVMAESLVISGKADAADSTIELDKYFIDPDNEGENLTYEITKPADEAVVKVTLSEGNKLIVDFIAEGQTNIEVKVTSAGQSIVKKIEVKVEKPDPVTPTDISLSNLTVKEKQPENTKVGDLTTEDLNEGATHTYELANTEKYPDNKSFTIEGAVLKAKTLDYETQNSYKILISSTNNFGLSFEKEFTVQVEKVSGIELVQTTKSAFLVYPNPVSDILVVQSIDGNQAIKKLEILTTTGQKVLEPTKGNQIDLSGLATGNYLVKIVTDKQVFVEQVVKK